MKFVKGISFFVIIPLLLLMTGFLAGVEAVRFFYPGNVGKQVQESTQEPADWPDYIEAGQNRGDAGTQDAVNNRDDGSFREDGARGTSEECSDLKTKEVSADFETLSVDTEYILEETDIVNHSVVEIVERLPPKYVGMDRKQFLAAMESYQANPPLSEQERGFAGLEVLSFSRERVVIQMNYEYLQPGEGFYLAVKDNEVVVYQEDCETIYINTGIPLETLPDEIQLKIIRMLWIEDEEALYAFLENYSS